MEIPYDLGAEIIQLFFKKFFHSFLVERVFDIFFFFLR